MDEGERAKRRGMRRAELAAGREWMANVLFFAKQYVKSNGYFTMTDIHKAWKEANPNMIDRPNAWGTVSKHLRNDLLITSVGWEKPSLASRRACVTRNYRSRVFFTSRGMRDARFDPA